MARLSAGQLRAPRLALVVTCEHASFRLPRRYGTLGLTAATARSHIAWDAGAREVARSIARKLGCPYFAGRYSRLLVDLNRSDTNPQVIPTVAFSVLVPANRLETREARLRIERYWRPYRDEVEKCLRRRVAHAGACAHIAVHSFTPSLRGRERRCDVGLLFDPRRPLEKRIAGALRKSLQFHGLRVRFNYPYRGTADGLTTALRKLLAPAAYAGIEVELNQSLLESAHGRALSRRSLGEALRELVTERDEN